MRDRQRGDRLLAIAVLGVVLLNAPLLSIVDRPVLIGGVPLLYGYLFAVWALLIGLTAAVVRRS